MLYSVESFQHQEEGASSGRRALQVSRRGGAGEPSRNHSWGGENAWHHAGYHSSGLCVFGLWGFEDSWHHSTVYFQCSVEYAARDIDDQVRAIQAIRALSEHVSANEPEWRLPTGRSVSHKWLHAPDGTYHLQVTEKSVFDSSLSSPEGPGGFSFNFGPRFLQTRYAERDKPRVGLLVSHTYKSRKAED